MIWIRIKTLLGDTDSYQKRGVVPIGQVSTISPKASDPVLIIGAWTKPKQTCPWSWQTTPNSWTSSSADGQQCGLRLPRELRSWPLNLRTPSNSGSPSGKQPDPRDSGDAGTSATATERGDPVEFSQRQPPNALPHQLQRLHQCLDPAPESLHWHGTGPLVQHSPDWVSPHWGLTSRHP